MELLITITSYHHHLSYHPHYLHFLPFRAAVIIILFYIIRRLKSVYIISYIYMLYRITYISYYIHYIFLRQGGVYPEDYDPSYDPGYGTDQQVIADVIIICRHIIII